MRCFLSYATPDRAIVDAVKALLQLNQDAAVFVDHDSIPRGDDWEDRILREVDAADTLCVIWSAATPSSKWVKREYTRFLTRSPDRRCVPLCIDGTPLPERLARRQRLDLFPVAQRMLQLHREHLRDNVSSEASEARVRAHFQAGGLTFDDAQWRRIRAIFLVSAAANVGVGVATARPRALVLKLIAGLAVFTGVLAALWIQCTPEGNPRRGSAHGSDDGGAMALDRRSLAAAIDATTTAIGPARRPGAGSEVDPPLDGLAGGQPEAIDGGSGAAARSGRVDPGRKTGVAHRCASFKATNLGIKDPVAFAAPADFDGDGWTDFVGSGETNGFLRIYRNTVGDSAEPHWADPDSVRPSSFAPSTMLVPSRPITRWRPVAAGDFNGDGWPDVLRAEAAQFGRPSVVQLWLNARTSVQGNATFARPYPAMGPDALGDLGFQNWNGSSIAAVDYDGDHKLDVLIGGATMSSGGEASIRIFLNQCTLAGPPRPRVPATGLLPCANAPTFATLMDGATPVTLGPILEFPTSAGNLPVFAFADVDGDGLRDLVIGGPACCSTPERRLRLFKGIAGGNVDVDHPQSLSFPGGATVVVLADFTGDGRLDLVVGTDDFNDNPGGGASTYRWVNSGTDTPFSDDPDELTNQTDMALVNAATRTALADLDVGFAFDYDHDPHNSMDLMIADANHAGSFFVLASRVIEQEEPCPGR